MFKNYTILALITPLTIAASLDDLQIGARAGIHITTALCDVIGPFKGSNTLPGGELTVEVERQATAAFSFGASASYAHTAYPALEGGHFNSYISGVFGYYHVSQASQIGLGINVAHQYSILDGLPVIYGNHHRLQIGVKMRNYVTNNIYTHIELTTDASPKDYHTLEFIPANTIPASLAIDLANVQLFSTKISVGYLFNED